MGLVFWRGVLRRQRPKYQLEECPLEACPPGGLSSWRPVLLEACPPGGLSSWRPVLLEACPPGGVSSWRRVLLEACPPGGMSYWRLVRWRDDCQPHVCKNKFRN